MATPSKTWEEVNWIIANRGYQPKPVKKEKVLTPEEWKAHCLRRIANRLSGKNKLMLSTEDAEAYKQSIERVLSK